ncbi:MAG: phosphoglycerate kinase, partial [Parcubacteria group bacterium]|nr:phosphoglycerate kinase [Parcubacteria group bacterium]
MRYLTPEIVKNKQIVMRVDFNVDFDNRGNIIDDFRIQRTLPTIKFLQDNQAKKIILISHLGRPQEENNFQKFTLKPIQLYLEKLLDKKVYFIEDFLKEKQEINEIPSGNIILLENIRFYPGEEKNDINFAKQLSELGDLYINEAFSVSHHQAASLNAITKFLPAYAGFLLKEEIDSLDKIKNISGGKLVIILGGAKIKDKLPLIDAFINKAQYVLVGGALANTIIKSWNFEVGKSWIDQDMLEQAK